MKKKIVAIAMIIGLIFGVIGCGNKQVEEDEKSKQKTVVFADGSWDSIRLHNAIAAYILENGYGYKTDFLPGSTENLVQGQVQGDVDIYMEQWPDNVQSYQPAVSNGDIIEVGINFDDNKQGYYVPRYVIEGDAKRGIKPVAPDLKSVYDLSKYADIFKDPEEPDRGRILNGPPAWAAAKIMEIKHETYGLDKKFNLVSSGSDSGLSASLSAAYEKGKPWVGYYWEPTWITGKYDLVLLEEPKYSDELWKDGYKCGFKSVECTITVSKDIDKNHPEIVEFLKKYKTNSELISEVLAYMQKNEADIDETAKWFIKEKQEVWKSWVSEEAHTKIMNSFEG